MAKYIECDECGKKLSGNDGVYVVNDNAVYGKYCSEECLEESLLVEWTDANMYIQDAEHLHETDEIFNDENDKNNKRRKNENW